MAYLASQSPDILLVFHSVMDYNTLEVMLKQFHITLVLVLSIIECKY